MSAVIESYIDLLFLRFRRETGNGQVRTFDMQKYYGYVTLDIMGELGLGESFHSLEKENEHTWIEKFFLGAKFGSLRTSLSRYYPLEMWFGSLVLRATSKRRHKNLKIGTDMITRRLEMGDLGSDRSDLISPVVGNVDEEKKRGITRMELNINILAMVMAGSQLSAMVLAAATYFLLRRPETVTALNDEIRTGFESEKDITVVTTQGMLYLEAVINEALRIHHPTPSDPKPRIIPPGGQDVA
ncbi:MAG: hypothetical protein Q9163_004688, partial [Psora crenata]